MKTKEDFELLLRSLTELETADLVEALDEHLLKNDMNSLRDKIGINYADEINELECKIENLTNEKNESDEEISEYKIKVAKALEHINPLIDALGDFENRLNTLKDI